jgi:hypothetical protein
MSKEVVVKKVLLLFAVVSLLIPLRSALPQTLSDYVKAVRGDTLVIKDYNDMQQQNSLYQAMLLDTVNVPAGRVYMLERNGYYPLMNNPTTRRPTVIVGEDRRILVNNHDAGSAPPLICGASWGWGVNTGGIYAARNLTVENCSMTPATANANLGWCFVYTDSANVRMTFNNCLFEHTRWVFVATYGANCNVTFRNCYFVNMNGQPCRRSAGVFDCFANLDTLLVENCTHIMAAGSMYRFRDYLFKRIIINHNTFVDCAGYVFMNPGYQSNVSLTNNLFVNSNVQSYPAIHSIDTGEQDPDWLPMGLVNVYPDSADVANKTPRRFLCQNNLAYWDPLLANMDSILNAKKVDGVTNWRSQKISMNSRTDSLFRDDAHYPYLVSDTWKNQMPTFTDSKDLFTTRLANLKAHALAIVDTQGISLLPDWRLVNTTPDKYINADWPIPADLSYSDAGLQKAGLSGFPLGDLNWFPTRQPAWLAQRTAEYKSIDEALNAGRLVTAVHDQGSLPAEFQLQQNYPNPFNPSTTISFSLAKAGYVTLKVYNILGQEVGTLLDGYQAPRTYNLRFEGTGLASGVYFYRLSAPGVDLVKKMLLAK